VCDTCGETKGKDAFLNRLRFVEKTCTRCRSLSRKRKRYQQEKKKRIQAQAKQQAREAKKAVDKVFADDLTPAILKEVRRLMAVSKHKTKEYEEKIQHGTATGKTQDALRRQQQKLGYYESVVKIIEHHAKRNAVRPLPYYLANTKLLSDHGFVCSVDDNDPDLLGELNARR